MGQISRMPSYFHSKCVRVGAQFYVHETRRMGQASNCGLVHCNQGIVRIVTDMPLITFWYICRAYYGLAGAYVVLVTFHIIHIGCR